MKMSKFSIDKGKGVYGDGDTVGEKRRDHVDFSCPLPMPDQYGPIADTQTGPGGDVLWKGFRLLSRLSPGVLHCAHLEAVRGISVTMPLIFRKRPENVHPNWELVVLGSVIRTYLVCLFCVPVLQCVCLLCFILLLWNHTLTCLSVKSNKIQQSYFLSSGSAEVFIK